MAFIGLILVINGFLAITEGGIILIIIGGIMLVSSCASLANESSNHSAQTTRVDDILKNKIDFLLKFYEQMNKGNIDFKQRLEFDEILKNLKRIKKSQLILKSAKSFLENEYDRVSKIHDDLLTKLEEKYSVLDDVPLNFEFAKLELMINEINIDFSLYDEIDGLLNYLLILSTNNNSNKLALKSYENFIAQFPELEESAVILAISCMVTKIIMDGKNISLSVKLKMLLNNVSDDAELRKELRKVLKIKIKELKAEYEKDNSEILFALLDTLDPTFSENYTKEDKLYRKLNLNANATLEEVEAAYKKMLVTEHPDRGGSSENWSEINEAYMKIKKSK